MTTSTDAELHAVKRELARCIVHCVGWHQKTELIHQIEQRIVLEARTASLLAKGYKLTGVFEADPRSLPGVALVTMHTLCAMIAFSTASSHQVAVFKDQQASIPVKHDDVLRAVGALSRFGSIGLMYDTMHPTETSLEGDLILDAIHMYREHLWDIGIELDATLLAEVWTASIRSMWRCLFTPSLYYFDDSLLAAIKDYKSEEQQWLVRLEALANAIVQRMITVICHARSGASVTVGKLSYAAGDLADHPVGGNMPTRDITAYVINKHCVLIVTEAHHIPLSDMPPLEGGDSSPDSLKLKKARDWLNLSRTQTLQVAVSPIYDMQFVDDMVKPLPAD